MLNNQKVGYAFWSKCFPLLHVRAIPLNHTAVLWFTVMRLAFTIGDLCNENANWMIWIVTISFIFAAHCLTVSAIMCAPLYKFNNVVLVLCNQVMNSSFNEQCIAGYCSRYLSMSIMQVNEQCIAGYCSRYLSMSIMQVNEQCIAGYCSWYLLMSIMQVSEQCIAGYCSWYLLMSIMRVATQFS